MIPDPRFNIWEHTRQTLFDLYARRARNETPEMTCHKQAVETLAPHAFPGMTVLDAGCGAGDLVWSFVNRGLNARYFGVDYTKSFIDLGRENIPPDVLPPERLIHGAIEEVEGEYDAVVCINTLFCLPDFRQGLERLLGAARRCFFLRTTLAEKEQIRYETDDYLDEGHRDLRAYFNIFALGQVTAFIEDHGFRVHLLVDEHTRDVPEISAGKVFPYRVLFAERKPAS